MSSTPSISWWTHSQRSLVKKSSRQERKDMFRFGNISYTVKIVSKHPRNPKHVLEEGGEEGEELEISEEERRFLRSRRRNFLMTWSWFEPLKAEQALPQGNTWVWLSSATPQSLATLTSCIVGIFYPEFLNFIPL